VFRIYDVRTGQLADIAPVRGREIYIRNWGPRDRRSRDLAGLRADLVADLIRRTAQRHRLLVTGDRDADTGEAAAAERAALNMHPPEYPTGAAAGLTIDVRPDDADPAGSAEPEGSAAGAPILARTAAARLADAGADADADPAAGGGDAADGGGMLAGLAGRGLDPLALRLALLERHYRQEAALTWAALADADAALREWRVHVAGWATHSSKPMCAEYEADFRGAFDDDLDAPGALRVLRTLAADQEIPPGSKFETLAHADQWLGLDITSEVGRIG
jgi:hypothetical protein